MSTPTSKRSFPSPGLDWIAGLGWIEGAPASGKSTRLLERLKEDLNKRENTVRLLVPTATLAEHLRNELARQGFVLRRDTVSTLSRFLRSFPLPFVQPGRTQLDALLLEILMARGPVEYRQLASSAPFRRSLANCLEELALAGADPEEVPGGIGRIYSTVAAACRDRGWVLRGQWLAAATQWLEEAPAAQLPWGRELLLDGFFRFSAREGELLLALSRRYRVQATRLSAEGRSHRQPDRIAIAPMTREQEVLAVAGEISRLKTDGVPLRRIGVLLRNPEAYAGLIDNIFSRLNIPSRSYLGKALVDHPWLGFLRDWLAAWSSNWDAEKILCALRWQVSRIGLSEEGDSLEKHLRQALPTRGFGLFADMDSWETWGKGEKTPAQWLEAFDALHQLAQQPGAGHPGVVAVSEAEAFRLSEWRDAMRNARAALESAARSFAPDEKVPLEPFWAAFLQEADAVDLRERDRRRDVVHVMDYEEGRQWDLDYVFAPGMLEGEFPRRPQPDPFLSEETRQRLGLRTLREREAEEDQLWSLLLTRAHRQLWLSYPLRDANGESNISSPYWEAYAASAEERTAALLEVQAETKSVPQLGPERLPAYRKPGPWSATEIEQYTNCAFSHFAARAMQWKTLPAKPEDRLDALLLGKVVHEALQLWVGAEAEGSLASVAEAAFLRHLAQAGVSLNYRAWMERLNLLRTLALFEAQAPRRGKGWRIHLEENVELQVPQGPAIRGRVDRFDLSPEGDAFLYDYKYANDKKLRDKPVQSGLYSLALAGQAGIQRVAQFTYIALKEERPFVVIEGERLLAHQAEAVAMAKAASQGVREGRVEASPLDASLCQYCDYWDVCRIRLRQAAEDEGEAGEEEDAQAFAGGAA